MATRRHDAWGEPIGVARALPDVLNMARDVCDRWVTRAPDRPAVLTNSGPVTYRALQRMADGLARHLLAMNVGRGDRVGVLLSQSAWTAAAHIAAWKIGAVSLPLFTLFGPDALRHRLADAECRRVVTDAAGLRLLQGLKVDPVIVDGIALDSDPVPTAATGPEDPAVLIYTSGTTGAPKGALHGHRVLRGHLPGVELSHNLLPEEGDVLWTPADWAWIGGLFDVLMPGLFHGVPVVAARLRNFTVDSCVNIISQHAVKNVFFPPTALRRLKAENVKIAGLRSVASGGEPLGAEMLDWGRAAFGLDINEFYGQTECNMTVSACAVSYPVRPGFIGRAVPGHDVDVIDTEGKPTEDEGDIAVRRGSPSMMLRYHNNAGASAAKFRGDWLLTGDRGIIVDGDIRFVGREDDVITSAGYRIGPGEVEDCLLCHPAVASVGVVGVPDPTRTERVTAFVVLQPGWEGDQTLVKVLQTHVSTRLAAHEYPRRIHFVSDLPMTITGKVLRRELRRWALEEEAV